MDAKKAIRALLEELLDQFEEVLRTHPGVNRGRGMTSASAKQYMIPVRQFLHFLIGDFPRNPPTRINLGSLENGNS